MLSYYVVLSDRRDYTVYENDFRMCFFRGMLRDKAGIYVVTPDSDFCRLVARILFGAQILFFVEDSLVGIGHGENLVRSTMRGVLY